MRRGLRNVHSVMLLWWKVIRMPAIYRWPSHWYRPLFTSLTIGPLELRITWIEWEKGGID